MVVNMACLRGTAEVTRGEEREMRSQAKKKKRKTHFWSQVNLCLCMSIDSMKLNKIKSRKLKTKPNTTSRAPTPS